MHCKHHFRKAIPFFYLLFLCYSGATHAADPGHTPLTEATDLAADAATAREQRKIILLLISQQHCPYCTAIKREVLLPINGSPEYENKLIIREIYIDLGTGVRSFQGELVDSRDFAYGYDVELTPTLLFLDPNGEELTERRIGVGNLEYYHYLLDRDIDRALLKLHQQL
jgi:thioredoxin-related protein